MPYADVPGAQLWYEDTGGDGTPLVLVHANIGNSQSWAGNVPANSKKAPVFVWIHGGALVSGSSREAMYDGKRLADTASELNSAAIHLLRSLRATDRLAGLTPARLSAL